VILNGALVELWIDPSDIVVIYESVSSENDRLRAENLDLLQQVEDWQMATGLCAPAEEHGGDPGGVTPKHLETELARLRARVAELEMRLRFYATPENWTSPSTGFAHQYDPEPSVIEFDRGQMAREVLGMEGVEP
jgi:hypothetical protein